jgi:hypothetical protein
VRLLAVVASAVFSLPLSAWAGGVVGAGTASSCSDAALNTALIGGGLVTFDCGTIAVTIDIGTGTGTKTIAVDTTLDGGGLITISGGNSVGVFSVNAGIKFTVLNLTIANGNSAGLGGGGIYNAGSLTVTNSTVSGNYAISGGGIYNVGTLSITKSSLSGNDADASRSSGGAIFNAGTTTNLITNSTFSGNSAGFGGGLYTTASGTVIVTNSTFSGNIGYGGGIFNGNGLVTVINTIIAASLPSPSGGGDCAFTVNDGGHNLDDDGSCGFSAANGSLSNTNPQLDPAGLKSNGGSTQTIALCTAAGAPAGCAATSPAINVGDPAVCAAVPVNDLDQRGLPRSSSCDPVCDIGAFEFVPKPLDVDANGTVDVATDIVYIARSLLSLTPVPASFRTLDPTIRPDTEISCRVNQLL